MNGHGCRRWYGFAAGTNGHSSVHTSTAALRIRTVHVENRPSGKTYRNTMNSPKPRLRSSVTHGASCGALTISACIGGGIVTPYSISAIAAKTAIGVFGPRSAMNSPVRANVAAMSASLIRKNSANACCEIPCSASGIAYDVNAISVSSL